MSDTVRVLSTLALKGAVHDLTSQYQAAGGARIDADFAPTFVLLERLRAGEAADVAVLTREGLDEAAREGRRRTRRPKRTSCCGFSRRPKSPRRCARAGWNLEFAGAPTQPAPHEKGAPRLADRRRRCSRSAGPGPFAVGRSRAVRPRRRR